MSYTSTSFNKKGGRFMEIILFIGQTIFYDALILSSVSYIIKRRIQLPQFGIAVISSLLASLIIFLTVPIFIFIVPFLTVRIAFSPQTMKQYGLAVTYFYVMSASLSGVVHVLRYFANFDLMNVGLFLLVGVLIAVAAAVLFIMKAQFVQHTYTLSEFEHNVIFYCGEESASGIGFVDTGNTLVDTKTQLPVMIVPRQKVENLNYLIETGQIPTWELPYMTVGSDDQWMTAFRPTLMLIDDIIVKDVVVGISPVNFTKYDFLLQPEIVGGVV